MNTSQKKMAPEQLAPALIAEIKAIRDNLIAVSFLLHDAVFEQVKGATADCFDPAPVSRAETTKV